MEKKLPEALDEASNITNPDPCAMEEWKQLQTIIGRLQGLEYMIRGWLLALIGGLITALLTHSLNPVIFLVIAILAIAAFCFMELATRAPKRRAIDRCRKVEESLRGGNKYVGPSITASLSDCPRKRFKAALTELQNATVIGFYVPVAAVVLIVASGDYRYLHDLMSR